MMDTIDQMRHVLRKIKSICKNSSNCNDCLLKTTCQSDNGILWPESWNDDDIERLTMKEGLSWTISLNP